MDRTSSSTWVRGLCDMFASQGLDVPRLLRAAGIDAASLDDEHARFGPDEISALWEYAVASSGRQDLGMDRELAARYVNFDAVGFATLSSADLLSALRAFARYLALISSATTFELEPQDADCWLVMGHSGYTRPVPPQRSAYSLLALLTLCRWVTRREINPLEAHFRFPAPVDPSAYHRAFGCAVRFGQADHRILISATELAAHLPSHNPALLELHEQVLQQSLAALGHDGIRLRVSEEIIRRLPQGEPLREEVAASLALSDRTLQRRLHAEGTSFQDLLNEARRELARKYLADPRYALGQVAYMLGFADQSNFFRACRRWFGVAPGQYRDQLKPAPQGQ